MLRTRRRFFCVPLLCLFAAGAASAQHKMSDPLFGILYDPQKAHFEKMPTDLAERCPKLRGRYVTAWVYGHLKASDAEYFLIAGLMEFQEDSPRGSRTIAPEEDGGLVVALTSSQCRVDLDEYFFPQEINPAKKATPITASPTVVNGILQDAFQKYATAFGGKQALLKLVKPGVAVPPVDEQLEVFKREPS